MNFKKRGFLVLFLIVLLVFAAGCGGGKVTEGDGGDTSTEKGDIKLGIITILSGDGAGYGTSIKQGFEIAQDRINSSGGIDGRNIALLFEDSGGDKNEAINLAQKLINKDEVLAILGPTYSGEMFAVGPIADQAKVSIMGTSTTATGIGEIGPYVFRNALPESGVIPSTVKNSQRKYGFKRVALMYSSNNDFTVSAAETFKEALVAQGIELVETQTFSDGDTNFQAQLTNVLAAKPEAIALSALYKEGALVLIQARQQGLDLPVMGGNGLNSPELMKIAGDAADGVLVGSPWFVGKDDPDVQAFVKEYNERYGTDPDQFAAQAYDALGIFAQAAKAEGASNNREAFRDALAAIKDYQGVTGSFSFDDNGNPVMEATLLEVVGGKYQEVK